MIYRKIHENYRTFFFSKNWHAKLKHWHTAWNVGTFLGKLARKPSWSAGTLARKPH